MRIYDLDIFRSDFRFVITDEDKRTFFVFYNDQDLTVNCSCERAGKCAHTSFIYEVLRNEKKETTLSFLQDNMEANSQAVTESTVERMRDAFAREYNLAKGIVQYPDPSPRGPRAPLGWQGDVPGAKNPMRVIEQPTAGKFMVYELGSDVWRLVVGIDDPECKAGKCRRGCKHEKAVKEAVREWRAKGYLPNTITLTYDDLKMVERAESYQRSINIPPGFDGTYTIGMTGLDALAKNARDQIEKAARETLRRNLESVIWNTTSATTAVDTDAEFDFKKFEEGVNKAKKLLEKTEEPKPEKPPKPRTRFTDLEL